MTTRSNSTGSGAIYRVHFPEHHAAKAIISLTATLLTMLVYQMVSRPLTIILFCLQTPKVVQFVPLTVVAARQSL